jgi:hypothetical protein
MRTVRIDEYICLDVDQIVIDEMESVLQCTMRHNDAQSDRDNMAKLKRAARVIRDNYSVAPRFPIDPFRGQSPL